MAEGTPENPQIKVHLVFDSNAEKELEKIKHELAELKSHTEKTGEHVKEHLGKAGHEGGESFGHELLKVEFYKELLEKAKEVAEQIGDIVKEGFAAAVGKLESQKGIRSALMMTGGDAGLSAMSDKAKIFQEDLEEMGVEAGVSGETLQQVFGDIAARSNKSALAVEELTEQIAYAGKAIPGGAEALGQGFAMMEMGIVRARNPVVQLIAATGTLHGNAKAVAAQMAKMTPEEQMHLGEEAIEKMAKKMKDVPPTFDGLVKSIKDLKEQALAAFGMPMVAAVVPHLTALKDTLIAHKEELEAFGEAAGEKVADFLQGLVEEGKTLYEMVADGGYVAEALGDAAGLMKDAFEFGVGTIKVVAEVLAQGISQIAEWYVKLKKALGGAAESGALGETAQHFAFGMKAKDKGKEMEDAAHNAFTPEGMKQFEKLRAEFISLSAAAGDAPNAIRQTELAMQHIVDTSQSMGRSLDKAAMTIDTKSFARIYHEAAQAHDKGVQRYAAELLASSETLQHALFKSAEDLDVSGMAKLLRGDSNVSKEDVEKMLKNRKADSATLAPTAVFNNATFQIHQDFRDQDPYRVAVVFRRDIVKSALARVSSNRSLFAGV